MAFDDFQTKNSVVLVYTGEGKGKTSASVGLMARALGRGWRVAYIQFIKTWETGESLFVDKLINTDVFGENLYYFRGGRGFYHAGELSAKNVSDDEHKQAAAETYEQALRAVQSGLYDVVICDEINNAVNDGLLTIKQLEVLIDTKNPKTSLCLTGRNFPEKLLHTVDIATNMTKIKHHFDDKFLANKGIDY